MSTGEGARWMPHIVQPGELEMDAHSARLEGLVEWLPEFAAKRGRGRPRYQVDPYPHAVENIDQQRIKALRESIANKLPRKHANKAEALAGLAVRYSLDCGLRARLRLKTIRLRHGHGETYGMLRTPPQRRGRAAKWHLETLALDCARTLYGDGAAKALKRAACGRDGGRDGDLSELSCALRDVLEIATGETYASDLRGVMRGAVHRLLCG